MKDLEKLKKDALGFPDRAKRMIVHDAKTLNLANDFIHEVKAMMKEVSESYDPIIRHAQAEKKKYIDPLRESEKTAKLHVGAYLTSQAEIQRKAEEEAKKIEEERQKKEEEILERAKKYQDAGQTEEADEIIEEIPLPAIVETPLPPAPKGLSMKQVLDFDKITQLVENSKGLIRIPGIEIYRVLKWRIIDRKIIPKGYYKVSVASTVEKED